MVWVVLWAMEMGMGAALCGSRELATPGWIMSLWLWITMRARSDLLLWWVGGVLGGSIGLWRLVEF